MFGTRFRLVGAEGRNGLTRDRVWGRPPTVMLNLFQHPQRNPR